MANGTSINFDASHHAVVNLLGLGAILVLPLARMPLLKLCWQRATSVLPRRAYYLCHLGPDLYSKCSCERMQLRDSYQLAGSKMVWTLVKRTITPVEVVKARCLTCSSILCLFCDHFAQIYTPKAAAQHLQPCRCIARSAMNCLGQRRKLSAAHDAA